MAVLLTGLILVACGHAATQNESATPASTAHTPPPDVVLSEATPTALPDDTLTTAATADPYAPVEVKVTARVQRFYPPVLTVPAHVAVTLVMENEDAGTYHYVGVDVVGGGKTETCKGPCTSHLVFGAHVPGTFNFFCSLHPEMVGKLQVTNWRQEPWRHPNDHSYDA